MIIVAFYRGSQLITVLATDEDGEEDLNKEASQMAKRINANWYTFTFPHQISPTLQ